MCVCRRRVRCKEFDAVVLHAVHRPPQDTKLAATQQQEAEWVKQQQEQAAAAGSRRGTGSDSGSVPPTPGTVSESGFHFICECFFMTLKALHMGVIKAIDELTDGPLYWDTNRVAGRLQEAQELVER